MKLFPPRRRQVYASACAFLQKEDVRALPVDPFAIIRRRRYALASFRRAAALLGETPEEVAALCQSGDGATLALPDGRFGILYNDDIDAYGRVLFTLLHELAHIELGHFELAPSLRALCYDELEEEAHFFASTVLAPPVVMEACGFLTAQALHEHCGLSMQAARRRLLQFAQWQPAPVDEPLRRQFDEYIRRSASPRVRLHAPDILCD